MTKARSVQQHREAIEVIAANAYRSMTDAKQLLGSNEETVGMSLARSVFPLVVQALHQRSLPSPNRNLLLPSTSTLLKGLKSGKAITADQYESLQRANVICTLGWDNPADAHHVIDTSLAMLEATESRSNKKRRQATPQAPAPKRFSFVRWAAGLLGMAGATS